MQPPISVTWRHILHPKQDSPAALLSGRECEMASTRDWWGIIGGSLSSLRTTITVGARVQKTAKHRSACSVVLKLELLATMFPFTNLSPWRCLTVYPHINTRHLVF